MTARRLTRPTWLDRVSDFNTQAGRGWRTVAAKELADHVLSRRFLVLLAILGLAALATVYFSSQLIRDAATQASGSPALFLRLFTVTGDQFPFPFFGLVSFVLPRVGIAFGFDAINGERSLGTFSRLLSPPGRRHRARRAGRQCASRATAHGAVTHHALPGGHGRTPQPVRADSRCRAAPAGGPRHSLDAFDRPEPARRVAAGRGARGADGPLLRRRLRDLHAPGGPSLKAQLAADSLEAFDHVRDVLIERDAKLQGALLELIAGDLPGEAFVAHLLVHRAGVDFVEAAIRADVGHRDDEAGHLVAGVHRLGQVTRPGNSGVIAMAQDRLHQVVRVPQAAKLFRTADGMRVGIALVVEVVK